MGYCRRRTFRCRQELQCAAACRTAAAAQIRGITAGCHSDLPRWASPLPAGIEQAIEKALDKKLAPVLRMLAEMHEQKVRLTDVLGGIGYIIGLVGVAAYFKRKP